MNVNASADHRDRHARPSGTRARRRPAARRNAPRATGRRAKHGPRRTAPRPRAAIPTDRWTSPGARPPSPRPTRIETSRTLRHVHPEPGERRGDERELGGGGDDAERLRRRGGATSRAARRRWRARRSSRPTTFCPVWPTMTRWSDRGAGWVRASLMPAQYPSGPALPRRCRRAGRPSRPALGVPGPAGGRSRAAQITAAPWQTSPVTVLSARARTTSGPCRFRIATRTPKMPSGSVAIRRPAKTV